MRDRCKGSKGRASWDGKEGEVFASAKGHELWRRAAIPRFCEDMQDDYGPSDGASGSSSRSDSSGRNRRNQGRIEDDGTGKEGEEAAYLKAWPGGVNLVACLREMLLGEPCYCPVSPAAPSTSAAPTTPAAPSTPASSSTPAAPPISVVPNHAKPAPALGTEYTGTAVGGERKVASGGELNAIEGSTSCCDSLPASPASSNEPAPAVATPAPTAAPSAAAPASAAVVTARGTAVAPGSAAAPFSDRGAPGGAPRATASMRATSCCVSACSSPRASLRDTATNSETDG
ncbi:unnamed protein product [Closterium sp. NIES-64]|nr:unnamed protein product [Closterium sp. NIES-64]